MVNFSQKNSPLRVFTPLEENTLLATSLHGHEKMGDTYTFRVGLIAKAGENVDFSKLLGAEARVELTLPGGAMRTYSGIISEMRQGVGDGVFDSYSMTLVPALHLLTLVRRSRIFQNQSATEIIDQVLQPAFARSGRLSSNFAGNTPARVYCTQYRETDRDFLRRLCAESGVTWFWVHTPDQRVFKISDNTSLGAPDLGVIPFRRTSGGTTDSTAIHDWQLAQSIGPPAFEVLDHSFQVAGQEIRTSSAAPSQVTAGTVTLQTAVGIAPWEQDELSASHFFDSVTPSGGEDGSAIPAMFSQDRPQSESGMRAAMARSVRAEVAGNCCQMAPGYAFRLEGHSNQDGDWLVVAAEHSVEVEGRYWAGEPSALKAEVRAECAPLTLRQGIWPIPPRPAIAGVLTGVVIGPPGSEMHVDRFGRVQVRFWWDRSNPSSSCWIRVAQSWAGTGWGAMFWPRIGHEVVVAFENGDPDRPIIVGSVYNSASMPPFPLPEHRYIAGWKSLTQGGDPSKNFHLVLMSDETGGEVVHIHAERSFVAHQESFHVSMRPNVDMSFQG